MQARAQKTRQKLLDATVDALVEVGFSGTTTQEVCRRAGVSRGTLQHHFKTRIELLVAALDFILADRVDAFVAEYGHSALEPDALVDLMWTQWQGPALRAWLELAVAARTTPALKAPMREVMLDFDLRVAKAFAAVLGEDRVPASMRAAAPHFVFALMNGLAVGRGYEDEGHSEPVLDLMKLLAKTLLGGLR